MANYTKINLDLQSDLVLTTANIGAVTGGLRNELDGIILSGSTAVATEQARAIAAEGVLTSAISAEVTNRVADVNAEETRALAAELVLRNDLATEVSNRVSDVNAEETRALAAEGVLTSAIAAEKTRAEGKESILSGEILTEKNRAEGIEGGLRTDVNSANSKVDAILASSAMSADTFVEIVALINSVDLTNDQAFAGYVVSNNAALASEVSNRITDVNAEETRALAAELVLRNNLATEVSDRIAGDAATLVSAKAYADGIAGNYDAAGSAAQALLDAEAKDVVRAATAVTNIATAKSEAIASAESKDAARYVTVTSDIATAKSAAIASASADATTKANQALVDAKAYADQAELDAIAAAEAKDAARATTTATNLTNAVNDVYAVISSTESNLMEVDDALSGRIFTEKGRIDAILSASTADKNSFAEIVTLINSVDTTNDTAFAGYVTSNNAALAAEVTNRIADVDAEETRALAAELVLRNNLATEVTNRIAGDAATLASAKSYADTQDGIMLQSANEYAANLGVNYDAVGSADNAQMNAAAYTDTAVSNLRADVDVAIETLADIDFSSIFSQKIGGKTSDNVTYVLSNVGLTAELPVMAASLQVFENGLLLEAGVDYDLVSTSGVNNAAAVKFKYEIKPDWKVAFFGVPFKASFSDLV